MKSLECGQDCELCEEKIAIRSLCKHKSNVEIRCKKKYMKWKLQTECQLEYGVILKCQHDCRRKCSECFGGYVHVSKEKWNRIFFYEHICYTPWSENCSMCEEACQNRCPKLFWDICPLCQDTCIFGCNTHQKCNKKCYEMCETEPCN